MKLHINFCSIQVSSGCEPSPQNSPSSPPNSIPLPSCSSQDTPSRSSHDTPSLSSQDTPSRSSQDTPSRSSQDTPSRSSHDTLSNSSQDSLSRSSDDTPSRSAHNTPSCSSHDHDQCSNLPLNSSPNNASPTPCDISTVGYTSPGYNSSDIAPLSTISLIDSLSTSDPSEAFTSSSPHDTSFSSNSKDVLSDANLFTPLYPGAEITLCGALCCVMQFCSHSNLSYTTIGELLKLLHVLCPSGCRLPKTFYHFKNFFESFSEEHIHQKVCLKCNAAECLCPPANTAHLVNLEIKRPLEVIISSKYVDATRIHADLLGKSTLHYNN
jgi:hypothetical protein